MSEFKLKIDKAAAEEIVSISKNYVNLIDPIGTTGSKSEDRHQFNKDYARILYSSSFRRLQGKMQFLSVASNQFYRNRLTHSHEVSQIARTIASGLKRTIKSHGITDFDLFNKGMNVIEAISLAHDIGNPPFGHAGEFQLNELMKGKGGYEGNAQTFRVLNKLERRYPNKDGLFLSKRTLLGVVKYIYKNNESEKFLYDSDCDLVNKIAGESKIQLRTLDAQIMDVSDEIAYAAHDLEDALRSKLFTIDELLFEFKNSDKYNSVYNVLNEMVDGCKKIAQTSTSISSEDYTYFFTKELTSAIVDKLVRDIGYVEISEADRKKTNTLCKKEINYTSLELLAEGLKKINFQCLIKSPNVIIYEANGKKIIKGLFDLLNDSPINKKGLLLPPEYRQLIESGETKERVICDYISGMMDTYSTELYLKYFGKGSLDSII
ncbi:MAG: deoxyguanosinetriphosphate triphosphohydrolase [Sphingobacteriaceae bacterium]|nr:deoxyguanosinetriphosphate triphosphohydrolase [Sphingobacteriaceae bacterium]